MDEFSYIKEEQVTESADDNGQAIEAEAQNTDGASSSPEDKGEALAQDESGFPVSDWEAEAHKFEDLYLRSRAEAENMRRRFQKEKDEHTRLASMGLIRDLMPFLDNLALALSYADKDDPAVKNLAEGLKMTLSGGLSMLSEYGLSEIPAVRGGVFDPNQHEALGQEPAEDLEDGTISQVVSKGYLLHQRLLRPAKVMVVKN